MKKVYIILLTVFLNLGFYSCTPDSLAEEQVYLEACCGDGGNIPPPPPPPGGGDN
jgi:hypothetical protein